MANNKNSNFFVNPATSRNKKEDGDFTWRWNILTVIICIIISFIIIIAAGAMNIPVISDVSRALTDRISGLTGGVGITPGLPFIGGRQNILLLGVDSNGLEADPFSGTRSDTIMVFNLDPFSKTINAVSIPRDSKVYIADNNGVNKINAAHAIGGPNLAIKTIQDTFGVRINHYIVINYAGVRELVDAVGGVPVLVEKRMRYRDRSAHLNIDLYPGYQTLNAEQAIGYLRFRHDAIGDIGRMRRQQYFIRGLVKRFQSPDIIAKIPQLIQIGSKYIRTDMNLYDLSRYAAYVKGINLSDVQSATLPGKPSRFGPVSYWVLDTEQSQRIIDKLIYREGSEKKDSPLTVSLLYSRELIGRLTDVQENLEKAGYSVACKTTTREPHSQIFGHTNYASFADAQIFKNKIPELKKAQYIVAPDNLQCGDTDYTIILTNNEN